MRGEDKRDPASARGPVAFGSTDTWEFIAACSLAAVALGAASAYSLVVAVLALALCLTVVVVWWARRQGDALVVAVALLVFWAPFHTSVSKYNLSPQEIGVYFIIFACVMLDRRGVWDWIKRFAAATPRVSLIAIGVFALACLQSVALAHGMGAVERAQALRSALIYPVLFGMLVAYTVHSRHAERVALQSFYGGALALAAYALTLKVWGVDTANGAVIGRLGAEASFLSQYHPNNLGLYFALALPFALPLWREASRSFTHHRLKQVGIVLTAMLLLLDILLAASRGTLLALAVSALVALLMLLWKGSATQRVVIGATVAGLVSGFVGLALWKGQEIFQRYRALLTPASLLNDPNVQFRLRLYGRALQQIKAHPLTGIGISAFASTGAVPFSPHDTYIDLWVSVGVFGLAAFLLVLGYAVWVSVARARRYSATRNELGLYYTLAILFALVAFITQGFVEAYDAQPRITPIIWMIALFAQVAAFRRMVPLAAAMPDAPATDVPEEAVDAQSAGVSASAGSPTLSAPRPTPLLASEVEMEPGLRTGAPVQDAPDDPFQISSEFAIAQVFDGASGLERANLSGALAYAQAPAEVTAPLAVVDAPAAEARRGAAEAEMLLRQAPSGYLWNQAYSLLVFGLNFALSVIIARGLSVADYGVYSMLSTVVAVLILIFAFGLEDAASVFVPRLLARNGRAGAASLIRRMLLLRTLIMVGIGAAVALGLPLLATPLARFGLAPYGFTQALSGFDGLRPYALGAYLAASAIVALQGAFFASILKTRATLIIGGLSQLMGALVTFALLRLGYGVDGIFAAQALVTWVAVIAFLVVLFPYLRGAPAPAPETPGEVRGLMISAWLTNVTNGALGKQMDILLMAFFAVSYVAIGYYNLAYQIVSIVAVLLISGLGGVGMAAMSAAYATNGAARLASMWRAIVMLQLLLAAPLQIFTFALANQIIVTVYGEAYAGAIPLLRIFIVFSFLGRMIGGGASQSALYVMGKQRIVLITRWIGFAINLALDIFLIRIAGPAGALVATGFSQLWVGVVEYIALRSLISTRYPFRLALRIIVYSAIGSLLPAVVPGEGLLGLVASGTLFVALFLIAALTLGLGDPRDIVEVASLSPRIRWLLSFVNRVSIRRT